MVLEELQGTIGFLLWCCPIIGLYPIHYPQSPILYPLSHFLPPRSQFTFKVRLGVRVSVKLTAIGPRLVIFWLDVVSQRFIYFFFVRFILTLNPI